MRTARTLTLTAGALLALAGCGVEEPDTAPQAGELIVEQAVAIDTAHPYANFAEQTWEVEAPADALRITLHLDRFETEYGYDHLEVFDAAGQRVHRLSGEHGGETLTVEGAYARLRFTSDWSITDWGLSITRYSYETAESDHPVDHRPYCGAIGSRSEGWYWGDTGERIRFERCAELAEPECGAIGSRSEGWYSNGEPALIAWDRCHAAAGWSLVGEACGPAINRRCHESYCHGLPAVPERLGETGTCREHGYCEAVEDCSSEDNAWLHPLCVGRASCEANRCTWHCGAPVDEGPWSWTTVLLRDIESPHPYPNNYDETWDVIRAGAEKIRVHFQRIEVEPGYDRIVLSGDREENAVMIDGTHTDYWSPEFSGDTLHINLQTDYSVTQYGFRADMVEFYGQLPAGTCNRDEDCEADQACMVPNCFNPYAPCYGECQRPDPEPGCAGDEDCAEGLRCKNLVAGEGLCREPLWCAPETVAADCAGVAAGASGAWTCVDSRCEWRAGGVSERFESLQKYDLPDNDPVGVRSAIEVAGMAECPIEARASLSIRHSYRGDLVVSLLDPTGQRAMLHQREGRGEDDLVLEDVTLPPDLGRSGVNGTWVLEVSDRAAWDVGTLERWSLEISCR